MREFLARNCEDVLQDAVFRYRAANHIESARKTLGGSASIINCALRFPQGCDGSFAKDFP